MKIVSEIQTVLLSSGLTVNNARGVAILWLQNIANLPLLLTDSPHVERYCKEMGISSEQLLNYMDTFGLNVSVLDDLLALKDGSKAGVGYDPKKWTPRKGIY